jgi:subtilase-type serine protease
MLTKGLIVCFSLLVFASSPASANQWSYPGDPGFVATNPSEVPAATLSWETPEYLNPWGLPAENASTAYALGYYGQGVTVGIMDSGVQTVNPVNLKFQGGRFIPVVQQGVYGTSGYRYRDTLPANPFYADQPFYMTGEYNSGDAYPWNASHGTNMVGIIGANRDGNPQPNMHGFAFASTILTGNTGASDENSHGPYHDYTFVYTGYKALVDAGAQVINSSWGQICETVAKSGPVSIGPDGGSLVTPWLERTLADEEFIYFYFKKFYSSPASQSEPGGYQYDPNNPGLSFEDAMYNAVKDTNVVHVRSAANTDQENPNNMAFYPYFYPDAEKHWIAAGGLKQSGAEYILNTSENEAGPYAKWWYLAAPNGDASTNLNNNTPWGTAGGTSGSSPHITGALALLLSRYPNMNPIQVREVLLTTAQNKNSDGTFLALWTAPDGQPDPRYGWGYPNIGKAVYGPGQFLGPFTYNMEKAPWDVWSNNISQVAINEKEQEDLTWLANYKANGIAAAGPYNLNEDGWALLGIPDIVGVTQPGTSAPANWATIPAWEAYAQAALAYMTIDQADANNWRKEWMDRRKAYIENNIRHHLYTASLVKQGPGELVMTGANTYEGGTTVEGGTLSINGSQAGSIFVQGGTLGGSGSVAGSIDVARGLLQPGFTPQEAAQAVQVSMVAVAPGNVLNVGGDVRFDREGGLAVTIRSDTDYTSVAAAGGLVLDGELVLNVQGPLTQGAVLTIMTGGSVRGSFDRLPENSTLLSGGYLFRVSYRGNSVTLTVMYYEAVVSISDPLPPLHTTRGNFMPKVTTITVSNTGNAPLTITANPTVTETSGKGYFSIVTPAFGTQCTPGLVVAAGRNCTIGVEYYPYPGTETSTAFVTIADSGAVTSSQISAPFDAN